MHISYTYYLANLYNINSQLENTLNKTEQFVVVVGSERYTFPTEVHAQKALKYLVRPGETYTIVKELV